MTDKKLTDGEIVKALEELLEIMLCEGDLQRSATISKSLDLINRLQAENEKNENIIRLADKTIETANVEIERLKNAYKQVAWERDIFAEDMKQEIKKDCSYLMLDIKTIKAEAYKECIEKVKNYIKAHCNPYGKPDFDYDTSIKILNFIDNLAKEIIGE